MEGSVEMTGPWIFLSALALLTSISSLSRIPNPWQRAGSFLKEQVELMRAILQRLG
jgi:hypothetical protein